MNRPDHVTIGPFRYEVIYDEKQLGLESMDDATEPAWGHISFKAETIVLDPRRTEAGLRTSLIHEILHGVFDVVGVHHNLDDYNLESLIQTLDNMLTDTLRENPQLLLYLLEDADDD